MKIQYCTQSWTCVYLLSISLSSSFKGFHHHNYLFLVCLTILVISCPIITVHTSAVIGMFCWVCATSYTAKPRHDVHSPGLWLSQCVVFQVWCGWYHRWVCPSFSHIILHWHFHCSYLHLMSLHNLMSDFIIFFVPYMVYTSEIIIQVNF